jgi:hypothetical protein
MDKNAKLKELEERQRSIADEIEKLRKADDVHKPEQGDVYDYSDSRGKWTLFFVERDLAVWLEASHQNRVGGYFCGNPRARSDNKKFLGRFNDVFITKQRVAEILSQEDFVGDSVLGHGIPINNKRIRDDLAAEGITEVK